jgi:hypothetical protein
MLLLIDSLLANGGDDALVPLSHSQHKRNPVIAKAVAVAIFAVAMQPLPLLAQIPAPVKL